MGKLAKRKWLWLGLGIVLVVPVFACLLLWLLLLNPSEAELLKVNVGMTENDVRSLVGDKYEGSWVTLEDSFSWYGTSRRFWPGKKQLLVHFAAGRAQKVEIRDTGSDERSLAERCGDEYDYIRDYIRKNFGW